MAKQNATPTTEGEALPLNEFQQRVLLVPEAYDLFLGGGRGGGKSYALAALALRHVEQYRGHARVLYLRKTYKGLADFELICRELFGKVYGPAATFNGSEHVWRFANGAYFELGQIDSAGDYAKVQGRSFSLLMVDEAGQYAEPGTLDMVRSNLRGPRDVPIRMVVAANPGGPGHYWIAKRYVFNAAPWHPFVEEQSKRTFVSCPSTFDGNPFIDGEQYRAQLESSCVGDPELLRAWTEGDWAVARGAYFAAVLDEGRNAVDPWPELPQAMRAGSDGYRNWDGWKLYLAHDYGSSAPSVTYVVAKSPGREGPDGKFYPRDSLVLVDELATVRGEQLNTGLGWTVPVLAEEIRGMCARWRMRPQGVADDAIFAKGGHAAGSIADEFRAFGVHFDPAKKADRLTGWTRMKRLLADAGKPDVPGLYVSRACRYFWATVPSLARDQRRIEDVDSTGPDHAADAARYGCLATERRVIVEPLKI